MNNEIIKERIREFHKAPTDNVDSRMPQALHFLRFMSWFDRTAAGAYLDGASASEATYKQSIGAGEQTVGFVRHTLGSIRDEVVKRVAENERRLDAQTDPRRKHQVDLVAAIKSKEEEDTETLATALALEANNHEGYLLQRRRNGEPNPAYWTPSE